VIDLKRRTPVRKGVVPPRLRKLMKAHLDWRLGNCLNLLASENFSSPAVREMLSTDLSNRYTSPEGFYMGTRYIDQIQAETEELARDVFGAKYADVRPLSGHSTDMILLTGLTKPGDKVMVVDKSCGGYPGISQDAFPKLYGLQVCEFPFDKTRFNIDAAKASEVVQRESPKLVIFGASLILFPHPVQALADSCRAVGAKVAYDGSHVLGLIAGKQFQDPLREGAGVLVGSTHKSLFGPQGGMILANEYEDQLRTATYPSIVDNAHWNRIAALYVALSEAKKFGGKYATQVIKNSKALANALNDHGIALIAKENGFTQSHQTIVDVPSEGHGLRQARRLEEANIIVDMGIRIGTSEETRRGMREPEMERIAELIARVWVKNEPPKSVRKEVKRLRREFSSIRYC
jgi:glycine hydroxymethyltransferase